MKVTHICLCGPFTDNFSYQENLLTKYHKKLGHDVTIISSKWSWNKNGEIVFDDRDSYINENNILITKLDTYFNKNVQSKFKVYKNLKNKLKDLNSDILFIHGTQFLDLFLLKKYFAENPNIKVYIDNHADFSNSATSFLSKIFLHKILWRASSKYVEDYVEKFYGVLPSRVEFLTEMYGIQKNKVDLLLLGIDDDIVESIEENEIKEIRNGLRTSDNELIIITGGKIDSAKAQTMKLIKYVKEINDKKIKLIIFGSITKDLECEFRNLVDNVNIIYVGWLNSKDIYKYLLVADLGVFLGRHSVIWEQAIGLGLPCIFKKWEGMSHINRDGNCILLEEKDYDGLPVLLNKLHSNREILNEMRRKNLEISEEFSYFNIAKKSIEN